jgi:hypothetical protein
MSERLEPNGISISHQSINLSTHANQAVKNGPSHPRRRTRPAIAKRCEMDGGCNQRNIIGLKQYI